MGPHRLGAHALIQEEAIPLTLARCALILTAIFLFVSCTDDQPSESPRVDRVIHDEGDGPLSASMGRGGNSLDAPKGRSQWAATFGAAILCSTSGEQITLERVRYDTDPGSLELNTVLRVVSPLQERPPGSHNWAPISGIVGALDESPAGGIALRPERPSDSAPGEFIDLAGSKITQPCGQTPDLGFTEMLTGMRVDADGAAINGFTIEYRVADTEYGLKVDWSYVACGRAFTSSDVC